MIYLKMFLFLLSFFGINLFVNKVIKINKKISLPISIILITLFLYLFSLISLLKLSFILLFILGLLFLLYFIIKKEINYKELFSIDNILFIVLIIYIILIGRHQHFNNMDNYTHWGLLVNLILENGNLPKTMDVLSFAYPPGTALFISYFAYICHSSEQGIYIIAQNIIILSFLKGIFNLIDTKMLKLKRITFFLIYLFMQVYIISFNDLLVDSLIPIIFIFTLLLINKTPKNKNNIFFPVLISLIYLYLVKNNGLLLSLVLIIVYHLRFHNKKHLFFLLLSLFAAYGSWTLFVNIYYKDSLESSIHYFGIKTFTKMIKTKGYRNSFNYLLNYTMVFFNYLKYYSNLLFLLINILLIIFILCQKKNKIKDFHNLLVLDSIYILYFFGLGLMYVISMPEYEASIYSCYDRYMMVPLFIIILIITNEMFKRKNQKGIILLICFFSITTLFSIKNILPFMGIDNYQKNEAYYYEYMVKGVDLKNKSIGFYTLDNQSDTFILYYTIYKYRTRHFGIIYDMDIIESYPDAIIVIDHHDLIEDKLFEIGYQPQNAFVYLLKEETNNN